MTFTIMSRPTLNQCPVFRIQTLADHRFLFKVFYTDDDGNITGNSSHYLLVCVWCVSLNTITAPKPRCFAVFPRQLRFHAWLNMLFAHCIIHRWYGGVNAPVLLLIDRVIVYTFARTKETFCLMMVIV